MENKQTAVEWLFEKITEQGTNPYWDMRFQQALQMEKEQMTSYIVTTNHEANVDLSELNNYNLIPELSDEEIEKAFTIGTNIFTDRITGAKWYREQLKQKQ